MLSHNFSDFNTFPQFYFLFFIFFIYNPNASDFCLVSTLFPDCFYISAFFICTYEFISFFQHVTAAVRTLFFRRLLPRHEITLRIILTSVIFSAFSLSYESQRPFRIPDKVRLSFQGKVSYFCIPEIPGHAKKFSMRPVLDYHVSSTFFADHICHFIFDLDTFQLDLCTLLPPHPDPDRNYGSQSFHATFPSSTISRRPSIFAVKFASTILGK